MQPRVFPLGKKLTLQVEIMEFTEEIEKIKKRSDVAIAEAQAEIQDSLARSKEEMAAFTESSKREIENLGQSIMDVALEIPAGSTPKEIMAGGQR